MIRAAMREVRLDLCLVGEQHASPLPQQLEQHEERLPARTTDPSYETVVHETAQESTTSLPASPQTSSIASSGTAPANTPRRVNRSCSEVPRSCRLQSMVAETVC